VTLTQYSLFRLLYKFLHFFSSQAMINHNIDKFILPHIGCKTLSQPNSILVVGLHDVRFNQLEDGQRHSKEHHLAMVEQLVP
jgi:hypothetical protein